MNRDMGDIRECSPADRVEDTSDDFSEIGAGKDPWVPPEPETVSVFQRITEDVRWVVSG